MWKATAGLNLKPAVPPKPVADDDWETDPDFINNVTEKESRWGAKTVQGSGHQESIRLDQLREQVLQSDRDLKAKHEMPKASDGYGGKFGVQTDRQDKSAVGYEYNEKSSQHVSQKDYKSGFGGQFDVQSDRQDKSAHGWNSNDKVELHESQKDYKTGFGGKFGLQKNQDKSAVGWDEQSKPELHESQTGYKTGFGGKFGLQKNQDKSAHGWDEQSKPELHESQTGYKTGFGGKFGLQKNQDKSAVGWEEHSKPELHESQKKVDVPRANASNIRSKFEQMTSQQPQDDRVQQERERRKKEDEELQKAERMKQQHVDVPAERHQKVVREEVPAVNASSLRNKFEQMTQQQDDKVQQERERRKKEDEELRRRNEEAERLRQQRIEEQHAQMPDVDTHEPDQHFEPSSPPASSRNRASIGVRLPIAPQSVEPAEPTFHHEPHSQPSDLYESVPAEPEPEAPQAPRVQVLPPITNFPSKNALPRRQCSTDDEQNADEAAWDDASEPTVFKLPTAQVSNFPEEPSEPIPTVHVTNNTTVFSASPPQQQHLPTYDFVPDAPNESHSHSSTTTTHHQPSDMYDYVPDEPPAMQATLTANDLYEEPPAEVAEPSQNSSSGGLTAIAMYEYEKQDDDEISFDVGDLITSIEQIDAGWWRGFCKDRYGLFPSNYVQLQ